MFKLFFLLALLVGTSLSAYIDQVDDTDLIHLLSGEGNVIVLFTKNNCPECDELETVVENVKAEMKDSLGAVVVKALNSQLVGIYDPTKEPALVYFRKGIPLLYDGKFNEESIMEIFSQNREPVVKELADTNFEHLTQAATGATTGDWFVFFYSADCVLCQRLYAVWEAVGARLKIRLNVARVNRLDAGKSTADRFSITSSPEFIYLRQGKVYRYKSKEYTPAAFIKFVEHGYHKQTSPEDVPPVPSFMTNLLISKLGTYYENPMVFTGGAIIAFLIVVIVCVKLFIPQKTSVSKKNKKTK